MSNFITKEFVIPSSSPPLDADDGNSKQLGMRASRTGEVLPAIPDSLTSALARDPPTLRHAQPSLTGRLLSSPNLSTSSLPTVPLTPPRTPESSTHLLPPLLPFLPQIPPFSPLYDPSTIRSSPAPVAASTNSTSPTIVGTARNLFKSRSRTNLPHSGTASPSLQTSSSSNSLARGDSPSGSPMSDGDSSSTLPSKRSVWRSMTFGGKLKSSSDVAPTASGRLSPTSSSPVSQSLSPQLQRTTSNASRLGGEDSLGAFPRTPSSYGFALEEDESEVERLELQVEQAAARRASKIEGKKTTEGARGGRGIDPELDDMDFDRARGQHERGRVANGAGRDEVAVPWRGRTERYTFDLTEADGYESEREEGGGGVTLATSSLSDRRRTLIPGEESVSSGLLTRRRNTAPNDVPAAIFIAPTSVDIDAGPQTAPLLQSMQRSLLVGASLEAEEASASASFASRSISAGNVAIEGKAILGETELAAGLGITSTEGRRDSDIAPLPSLHRPTQADFVVAVVGPRGVGKSVVIRKGLKRPIAKPIVILQDAKENRATTSISQFVISGQNRSVEILEVDSSLLKCDESGVVWPVELPLLEGVMICYDATDRHALSSLSTLLHAFWSRSSDTPLIVLACKASADESKMAVSTKKAAELCNVYGAGIVSLEGGIEDPAKKMKNSFNWMIRTIIDNRGEVLSSSLGSPSSGSIHRRSKDSHSSGSVAPDSSRPISVPEPIEEVPVVVDEVKQATLDKPLPIIIDPVSAAKVDDQTKPLDTYFSREDMIDKLLFASVTGNDEQYVTLFLIIYRRFARPYEVLAKLIERFEFVGGRLKTDPLLSRFAQMKLCGILSIWFQAYPGDFIAPSTFVLLKSFLESLLPRGATWVAHYAVEVLPLLRAVAQMDDPDRAWGLPDDVAVVPASPLPTTSSTADLRSPRIARRPSLAPSDDSRESLIDVVLGNDEVPSRENGESNPTSQSDYRRSGSDFGTIATTNSTTESKEATPSLTPSITGGMGTKRGQMATLLSISNMLLDLPEEAVATQITRIAWEAFSEITPRDLLRHVLAPRDPKNPRTLLRDNQSQVMKSINFVNYLADWVASMLLVQSKLKHRVRLVEKFINIAHRLREQENFDSLMAILAGLSSQPIFRLTETTEAVNLKIEGGREIIPKRLRSLNKLMASSRSFGAYRLALANSGAYMIPYLGVHLQEITLINEVKKSSADGAVNWTKFQQMSRSSAIVLDCSRLTPQIPIDRSVERCIMTEVLDIDAQYALSYTHQPRTSAPSGRTALRKILDRAADSLAYV